MTIVFKVSDNVQKKMVEFYKNCLREKTPPYAVFQAQTADVIVTLYESGKAMFQGVSADIEANIWKDQESHLNNRNIDKEMELEEKKRKETFKEIESLRGMNCIGSDEVGTGDYFGPIVVTAAYVSKEQEMYLLDLKVKDSKIIPDERINKIAPEIIKNIPYKTYILTNEDFNKYTKMGYNMNKIKAILHNKVLTALKKEYAGKYDKIIIDQFVYPQKYFEHIKEVSDKVTDITFTPKAESKSLSVACASVISRYIFLKEMDKLSDSIHIPLPKGSGFQADDAALEVIQKYGFDKLNDIAKLSFKNTEKVKEKANLK